MDSIDEKGNEFLVLRMKVLDIALKRNPTCVGILGKLTSDYLDMIETEIRRRIAGFQYPDIITTLDEFTGHAFRFVMHIQAIEPHQFRAQDALLTLQRWHKGDLRQAARDAIYNRDGGFFMFIQKLGETLVQEQIDAYFTWVFWLYIPVDQDVRIRLAEEFEIVQRAILPNAGDLKKASIWAGEIEEAMKNYAKLLHHARRLSRY